MIQIFRYERRKALEDLLKAALHLNRYTRFKILLERGGFSLCFKENLFGKQVVAKYIQPARYLGGYGYKMVRSLRLTFCFCDVSSTLKSAWEEARIWGSLQHPNIIPFLGISETSEGIFLFSPLMEHGSADKYIQKFPNADRVRMVSITQALSVYIICMT